MAETYDNLANLSELNEGTILHQLEMRYTNNDIYVGARPGPGLQMQIIPSSHPLLSSSPCDPCPRRPMSATS